MTEPDLPDDDLLAPLRALEEFVRDGDSYFRTLAATDDPILSVGGLLGLMERGAVRHEDIPRLLELSRFGAVRGQAFDYFERRHDHILTARLATAGTRNIEDLDKLNLEARARADNGQLRDVEQARYLARGDVAHLRFAARFAGYAGGWRAAVQLLSKAVAVKPGDADAFTELSESLESASRFDLLEHVISQVAGVTALAPVAEIFKASACLAGGDAQGCLSRLEALELLGRTGPKRFSVGAFGEQLKAKAYYKLGRFRESFKCYASMNAMDAGSFAPTSFVADNLARNAQALPELPELDRPNYVMMLGFPRSGTTMLENALAAHPLVETFEEVPSMQAAATYIARGNSGRTQHAPQSAPLFVEARERYFLVLDKLSRKGGASVYVDKLPMRSIMGPFMKRFMPHQRFIFSIRHPYDVALSCFQQRFSANPAMANFLNLADTIKLYDLTMTEWFKVHSMDDPLVHYIRYDKLVTDFEETTRAALKFLGLGWDPVVLDFAERAGERGTRTPSYQKVRQGLSIGVQTYWRDYGFLFRSPEAAPLTKWAKFFGYETF